MREIVFDAIEFRVQITRLGAQSKHCEQEHAQSTEREVCERDCDVNQDKNRDGSHQVVEILDSLLIPAKRDI